MAKEFGKVDGYISDRPSFQELCNLKKEAEDLVLLVIGLDDDDADQIECRATDLHTATYEFLEDVTKLVGLED